MGCKHKDLVYKWEDVVGIHKDASHSNNDLLNPDRNCSKFKKKLFARTKDKKYCGDCRYFVGIGENVW